MLAPRRLIAAAANAAAAAGTAAASSAAAVGAAVSGATEADQRWASSASAAAQAAALPLLANHSILDAAPAVSDSSSGGGGSSGLPLPMGATAADPSASPPLAPWSPPTATYVKVRYGEYIKIDLPWADLAGMTAGKLLRLLASHDDFSIRLAYYDLDGCRVSLLRGVTLPPGKEEPNAFDERAGKRVPLRGVTTLGAAAAEAGAAGAVCWVHITSQPSFAALDDVERLQYALPYAALVDIPGQPQGGCQLLVLRDRVGNPVMWPGLDSDVLFIRPIYREFYEREDLLCHFRKPTKHYECNWTIVRAMTCKTAFSLYCLWRTVELEDRSVVFRAPATLSKDLTIHRHGESHESVSIADGVIPDLGSRPVLMVAPPHDYAAKGIRSDSTAFYMPEPTEQEMRLMRDTCFPHANISEALLEERIARWGRLPLKVLASGPTEKDQWEEMMRRVGLTHLKDFAEQSKTSYSRTELAFQLIPFAFHFDTALPHVWPPAIGTRLRNYWSVFRRWVSPEVEHRMLALLHTAPDYEKGQMLRQMLKDWTFHDYAAWEPLCAWAIATRPNPDYVPLYDSSRWYTESKLQRAQQGIPEPPEGDRKTREDGPVWEGEEDGKEKAKAASGKAMENEDDDDDD